MVISLITALYVLGFVFSYRILRRIIRTHNENDWIVIEKMATIAISLFSWLSIISIITILLFQIDLDKKCKW